MQTLSIRIPASVNAEVVRKALQALGAQVVERVSRKVRQEVEFVGMPYIKRFRNAEEAANSGMDVEQDAGGDWYAPLEMDGVTVAKAIRKMDNARKAYNARDGRDCYTFPQRDDQTTAQYVGEFCRANNLKN